MDTIGKEKGVMGFYLEESRHSCATFSREEYMERRSLPQNYEENITNTGHTRQVKPRIHDKKMPRNMVVPSHHKRQPHIIEESVRRCREVYKSPLSCDYGKASYHPDKPNEDQAFRKVRSEAREALTHPGIQALLRSLNLQSMTCGITDKKTGKFIPHQARTLANKALMSYPSFMRFLHRLESHGYITLIKETYIDKNGKKKYKPIVIKFNLSFFYDLNFTDIDLDFAIAKKAKQESQFLTELKANEYKKNERSDKKVAKQQIKSISKLIQEARRGEKLNEDEESRLDKEQPGWRGKKQHEELYPDFTGITHDKEAMQQKIYGVRKVSDIQNHFMKEIMQKLSGKMKPPD